MGVCCGYLHITYTVTDGALYRKPTSVGLKLTTLLVSFICLNLLSK